MFNGEIVFAIADVEHLKVDFGTEIVPTKIVNKDDLVVLGRKAPKNKWMYKIAYKVKWLNTKGFSLKAE